MNAKPLPRHAHLEEYRTQAEDLLKACRATTPGALHTWTAAWIASWAAEWLETQARLQGVAITPALRAQIDREVDHVEQRIRAGTLAQPGATLADAQFFIAREHGFDSWPAFVKHLEATADERSPVAQFEVAADAIIAGDETTVRQLLAERPELVRARSTRKHRATLLHYVAANGVEDDRQKTPRNIVDVTRILLDAGAEIDALAEMYGKDTTLGLAATSVHPVRAGVQIALIETLLEGGATIDGIPGTYPIVNGCLANGRGEAAAFLARRGARLDLEGAAGVGRLDLIQGYFEPDGRLKTNATRAQLHAGFDWACEYGRTGVVELLWPKVDVVAQHSGLHWAAVGGYADTMQLFLDRGASLEVRSRWGGTVLGTVVYCAEHNETGADYAAIAEMLVAAGAKMDADPGLRERVEALLGRRSETP